MMFMKYGDVETINVIEPTDVTDEETKNKLDELKDKMEDNLIKCDLTNQETK